MAASLHGYICMLQWFGCLGGFIYGLTREGKEWSPQLWYASLIAIIVMPVFNELFLCLKGCLLRSSISKQGHAHAAKLRSCIPIVYSPGYNIHAFGLEKCHPFDSSKYRRIYAALLASGTIDLNKHRVHEPAIPSREFLQDVMSKWYLFTLNYTLQVVRCIELPLVFLPGWFLRMRL